MPKIGLQMYTLRDLAQQDFVGTLKHAARIGYQGVEFAGFWNVSPKELRKVVSDLGLAPVSNHVPLTQLESNLNQVIEDACEIGIRYIVCPWLDEDRRRPDDYKKLSDLFNCIGEKCRDAGLKFAYHNHAFEFEKLHDVYALDALYNWTDHNLVQAELDIYWIEFAGESAAVYIERYQNRCELLHVKDMTADSDRFFAEVGQGGLNMPHILSVAEQAHVEWFIVEQDVCQRDPLESIAMSYQYLSHRESLNCNPRHS